MKLPGRSFIAALIALTFGAGAGWCAGASQTGVTDLRCEYLDGPLGIDIARPRLAWKMEAPGRGQRQTAWRVLVASDPEKLKADSGDLFDSGKVASDQSTGIEYAGKPLESFQACFWKVRVWDKDGRPSPWSKPARWTMGVMDPAQWHGQWIGYEKKIEGWQTDRALASEMNFDGAQWVWYPEPKPAEQASVGKRYFRGRLQLPEGMKIKSARLLASADDRIEKLAINGQEVKEIDPNRYFLLAQEIGIAPYLKPGLNVVAAQCNNADPGPAGFILKIAVTLENGKKIELGTGEGWKAAKDEQKEWTAAGCNDTAWPAALAMGKMGMHPWGQLIIGEQRKWTQVYASPIFRKNFTVTKPVRSATVTISGLGFFELRLNGRKVGDHELDPAISNYDKQVYYVTHDVTEMVREGKNAVGVMLGSGWYDAHERELWDVDKAPWRDRAKLLAQIRIVYRDGTQEWIATDPSWRAATGPVIFDGIRNGETYDARRDPAGWDKANFDDSKWAAPKVVTAPRGQLRAQMIPPVKVMQTLRPVAVAEPKPGVYVFDMGQNMAGRVQLHLSGPAGTRVRILYGERLAPDGQVTQAPLDTLVFTGPFQEENFILGGHGQEALESHFTYHGFRYVQVSGCPGKLTADSVSGQVMYTSFTPAGSFECSDPMVNAIQKANLWSYTNNFHGIPTDCPTREKSGWTADAHLATEQALYNFQNTAGYEKWLEDFRDDQTESGGIHDIVPSSGWGSSETIDWAGAYILIPWYLYVFQGDRQVLESHYEPMKRLLEVFAKRFKDTGSVYGLGDWIPAKTATPAELTSLVYLNVLADTFSKIARVVGKGEDAKHYGALAEDARKTFNKKYYKGDGLYGTGTQAAEALALYYGLAEPGERGAVLKRLVENIHAQGDHLDVGVHGAKVLFTTLSENGLHPLAYKLAMQKSEPSYGYWIASGETTFLEGWSLGSGSHDHIMFGDISRWFYQTLAGINPDPARPGFKHIILRPRPVAGLAWVKAEHDSPYGKIVSRWEMRGGRFTWNVTVPPGATATAWIPARGAGDVSEGGRAARQAKGVRFAGMKEGAAVFELEAGSYKFEAPAPKE